MSLSEFHIKLIEKEVGGLCHKRTSEYVWGQLEYGYKIEKQDILISELRPIFTDTGEMFQMSFAKIKFIKSRKLWKLYWQRGNGKWLLYESPGESKDLSSLVKAIDGDQYGCFFG